MMISMPELLSGNLDHTLSHDQWSNLCRLHWSVNSIRTVYNAPMAVTSGFRSTLQHQQIYIEKNRVRALQGLSPLSVPMGSLHLMGGACDISDRDHQLQHWLLEHLDLLESLHLYCEAFEATKTWVHLQIYPPLSGKRFFEP